MTTATYTEFEKLVLAKWQEQDYRRAGQVQAYMRTAWDDLRIAKGLKPQFRNEGMLDTLPEMEPADAPDESACEIQPTTEPQSGDEKFPSFDW